MKPSRNDPEGHVEARSDNSIEGSYSFGVRSCLAWSLAAAPLALACSRPASECSDLDASAPVDALVEIPDAPMCATCVTPEGGAPGVSIALGAFIDDHTPPIGDGGGVSGQAPYDPNAMTSYAAMVGGSPSIVMWYEKWAGAGPTAFPAADAERVVQFGATPMITWEACDPKGGICQDTAPSDYTDKNVAAGMFDAYLTEWAQAAKAWGKPFFLRLNHEMNGTWYPWGTSACNPNQNTHADYVAAWQHVHQVLDAAGATNAVWVWSPNVIEKYAGDFTDDYPGDAWVDWVALDGYNWGDRPDHAWTSFRDVFGASYAKLTALTSKPLMFAETASLEGPGGDKGCWIAQGFCDLPATFPLVRAVVWYDGIDPQAKTDWRVNSSGAALGAWRAVVRDPRFQAGPPL
jgi:hypothetical protein